MMLGLDGGLIKERLSLCGHSHIPVPYLQCYAVNHLVWSAVLLLPCWVQICRCSSSLRSRRLALEPLSSSCCCLLAWAWRPRRRLRPGLAILPLWCAQFLYLSLVRATDCTSAITETAGRARAVKLLEIISTLQR